MFLKFDDSTNYTDHSINYPGRDEYERDIGEMQRQHLERVNNYRWQPCLHDQCGECHGTGVRLDGSVCIHMISCPCPKCTPYC